MSEQYLKTSPLMKAFRNNAHAAASKNTTSETRQTIYKGQIAVRSYMVKIIRESRDHTEASKADSPPRVLWPPRHRKYQGWNNVKLPALMSPLFP